jgi:hypothetical protein
MASGELFPRRPVAYRRLVRWSVVDRVALLAALLLGVAPLSCGRAKPGGIRITPKADTRALWTYPPQDDRSPSLVAYGTLTYPGGRAEPHLTASDGTTFVERWSPPRIVGLDGVDGKVRWSRPMPPLVDEQGRPLSPSIETRRLRGLSAKGDLLVAEQANRGWSLLLLSARDGSVRWRVPLPAADPNPVIVDGGDDLLFLFSSDQTLRAHATDTGQLRYQVDLTKGCPPPPPPQSEERLYGGVSRPVGIRGGRVLAQSTCKSTSGQMLVSMFSASDGARLWQRSLKFGGAAHWVEGGHLFTTGPFFEEGGADLFRELDPGSGAVVSETPSEVHLPFEPPMRPPVKLVAVGPAPARYFITDYDEFAASAPPFTFAVDVKADRVLERLAALPEGVTPLSNVESPFARASTPLADGRTCVVRDIDGNLARVPR